MRKNAMTNAFEKISAGLAEALAYARGEIVDGFKVHLREVDRNETSKPQKSTAMPLTSQSP